MDATTKQLVRAIALAICGLFAYILLEMVWKGTLKYYLNTDIFGWVVTVAGVLLAGMVLLRAGAWITARIGIAPDLAHDCCSHDHDHGHAQHAHSHEVSLWRLIVVAFPLMMLMAGFVPDRLSADAVKNKMSEQQKLAAGMQVASLPPGRKVEGAEIVSASMAELVQAARDPSLRALWESSEKPIAAKVKGQLLRTSMPGRYQLHRLKMTCCTNDATPVIILVVGSLTDEWKNDEWLEVTGPMSFQKDPTGGYTAVLHQAAAVKLPGPPSDLYLK
jgi:uncharacterized repeat protein (TIGR03943 family)